MEKYISSHKIPQESQTYLHAPNWDYEEVGFLKGGSVCIWVGIFNMLKTFLTGRSLTHLKKEIRVQLIWKRVRSRTEHYAHYHVLHYKGWVVNIYVRLGLIWNKNSRDSD